jgi:long-chain acyl-CoA synthetase
MNEHHLSVLVHRQAEKYGNRNALYFRDYHLSQWIPITWNEFSQTIKETANALYSLGIKESENIGIFSQNKPECLYTDFAVFDNHAVSIPLYATSSPEQVRYIVNDAQMEYLFVGEQYQYDNAYAVIDECPSLKKLIIFDPKVIKKSSDNSSLYFADFIKKGKGLPYDEQIRERISHSSDDDVANILYTSGTTGEPKGVLLSHSNYLEAFRIHDIRLEEMSDRDTSLNFLPLTHVFERAWVYYCIHKGVTTYINLKPSDVQTSLKEVRPTMMCSVPRFWEKVYIGVQEKIEAEPYLLRKLMQNAIHVGHVHHIDYLSKGKKPPLWNNFLYHIYDKTVIHLLKKTLGIEHGNFFPTAGAAVSDKVCDFVHSVGINMLVGYGLTESTATVSCEWKTNYIVGSVGIPMPGVEIKIGDENEILLRGKTITKGYYKKDDATAATIDADGWFHTGDSGYLKGDHLYLRERLKDLFKTSNGKYIVPQAIESQMSTDAFIDQIAVIADQRKFVSALIVPDYHLIERYAKEHSIPADKRETLLKDERIQRLMWEHIDLLQQKFAHYEQIKRITLLPQPFSMESDELTNTLKLKRGVIAKHYEEVINNMYKE